jgi:hypothetical protein
VTALAVPTGGLIKQRCDPYGAETRIKLMGGLYPEQYLGRHMWHCPREAAGTYRMVCRCGHRGQPMPLCGPGYVQAPDGQWIPHPGHVHEISRRQAGACPRCVWPPEARTLHEAHQHYERELHAAMVTQNAAAANRIKQAMLDAGNKLQELNDRGIIHKCPLHLEEVS